jgi:hypothetical protein
MSALEDVKWVKNSQKKNLEKNEISLKTLNIVRYFRNFIDQFIINKSKYINNLKIFLIFNK